MFAASQFGGIYFTHSQNSSIVLDLLDLMVDVPDVDLDLGIDFEGFDLGELANMLSDNLTFGQAVDISCTLRKGDYVSANDCAYYGGLGYLIRYNFTALHAAPIFQAVADEAIIREALDDNNFRIKPIIHPLPLTKIEDGVAGGDDAGMAWFLIVLSFPFITGSFATFVVAERESKSKHLQTVAGVEPLAYWLSTWLWDVANYQIALWITVILMFAFDVEVFTTSERSILSGVIALLVLFGPAAASFTYCITFMFKSPSVCNLVVIIGNFIIGKFSTGRHGVWGILLLTHNRSLRNLGYAGAIGCFLLRMLGENPGDKRPNLVNAAIALEWVLRLIPSFSLSKGLFNIMYIEAFVFMAGEEITVWYRTVILYEVIFLSLQSILYLLLAVQLDKWSSSPQAVSLWRKFKYLFCFQWMCSSHTVNSEVNELEEDDDVIAEQKRVLEGGTDNDTIIIKELSKTYDNGTVAVKNLSLGIPPGQCFGLLGINGVSGLGMFELMMFESNFHLKA
jgi:ATP-binding cassette subfamily A (ABC1) protein 3